MMRAKRPLDPAAVAAADAAVASFGKIDPTSDRDAGKRRRWMEAYSAAGGDVVDTTRNEPADVAEPCPLRRLLLQYVNDDDESVPASCTVQLPSGETLFEGVLDETGWLDLELVEKRIASVWVSFFGGPKREVAVGAPHRHESYLHVDEGGVTWEAEGLENPGGPGHSRVPHWPGGESGVTIGRGLDLKTYGHKKSEELLKQLQDEGLLTDAQHEGLVQSIGLDGEAARKRVAELKAQGLEISPKCQKRMFELAYRDLEADTRRLATKEDVVKAYGKTDFDALDPRIKDVLVDLRYRGDYTPATRKALQKHVVANDAEAFEKVLADESYWVEERGVSKTVYDHRFGLRLRRLHAPAD